MKVAKKQWGFTQKENLVAMMMAFVPLLGFMLFTLIPAAIALYVSFTDMDGFNLTTTAWNNFANWKEVFSDRKFGKSLLLTLYITSSQFISLFIALAVAVLLNQKFRGSKFYQSVFFIPYICSTVATSIMWRWMFNTDYGIVNDILVTLFGQGARVNWQNDPNVFMPMLIIVLVWRSPGYGIVMYGAAMTAVDPALYEAAEIDGAGAWKKFTSITFPAVSPTTFFLLTTGLISGLQTFDIARVFVGDSWSGAAGPNDMGLTTVLYIYNRGMFGYMPAASAMSWVLFAIIAAVTALNQKISKKWVSYD